MSAIQDLPKGDYELISFEMSDFQDNHGNYWCGAAFKGVSEPVRWVVKDPQQVKVGEHYYGHFTLETSKAGRPYIRFRREQKPEQESTQATQVTGASQQSLPVKKDWQPRDDNAIRAQWAIGQAVSTIDWKDNKTEGSAYEDIERRAKHFYAMVERVKGDDSPKAEAPIQGLTPEEEVAQRYAKQDAERIRSTFNDGSPVPAFDEVHSFNEEEPINLDDIPF